MRTVLGETGLSDGEITGFIDDASVVIDRLDEDFDDFSEDELRIGEKYYAAHLIAVREPRPGREANVRSFTVSYQEGSGDGIDSTWFGRRANEVLMGRLEDPCKPEIGVGSSV